MTDPIDRIVRELSTDRDSFGEDLADHDRVAAGWRGRPRGWRDRSLWWHAEAQDREEVCDGDE